MRRFIAPILGLSLIGLTGCPDREVSEVNPIQDPVLDKSIPVNINRNLDIIFLVVFVLIILIFAFLRIVYSQVLCAFEQLSVGLGDRDISSFEPFENVFKIIR